MSKENLKLYEKYKEVPENALKAFNNGIFKGTDINSMWRIKCLTVEFGPCGKGWFPEIVRLWSEDGANNEKLCFADIKLHFKYGDEWGKPISATGGSKIVKHHKAQDYMASNDEGYKMAVTDALGVACKYLGFGADVYWDNDKTKYSENETPKQKVPQQEPMLAARDRLIKLIINLQKGEDEQDLARLEVIKNRIQEEFKLNSSKNVSEEQAQQILDELV